MRTYFVVAFFLITLGMRAQERGGFVAFLAFFCSKGTNICWRGESARGAVGVRWGGGKHMWKTAQPNNMMYYY